MGLCVCVCVCVFVRAPRVCSVVENHTWHVAVGTSAVSGGTLATVRPCFVANALLSSMLVIVGFSPQAAHVFDLHSDDGVADKEPGKGVIKHAISTMSLKGNTQHGTVHETNQNLEVHTFDVKLPRNGRRGRVSMAFTTGLVPSDVTSHAAAFSEEIKRQ